MSKKNDNEAPRLDLGIGDLLASKKTNSTEQINPSDRFIEPTSIVTIDEDVGSRSNEFSDLAQTKQWGIIVGRAETALASEDDLEARLWWIRGHLGALSLPVSLLAAPFETVCRQLNASPRQAQIFKVLVSEIGGIMRERLRAVGDKRQEHSINLALFQLGLIEPNDKTRGGRSKTPSRAHHFELGSVEKAGLKNEVVNRDRSEGRSLSRYFIPLFILALLLCGLFFVEKFWSGKGELLLASEGLIPPEGAPSLVSPRIEASGMRGSLDAIYYSISDNNSGGAPKIEKPTAPSPVSDALSRPETNPPKPVPAFEKPAQVAKDVIDTSGPLEGIEFKRGVDARAGREARLPSGSEVSPRAKPIPGSGIAGEAGPEFGGVVLGEVKTVIAETNVLDSPSYEARILGKLSAGDKVSVESRNGRWLRIRSRRGKTGYVFAQDVGENEDFTLSDSRR